MNKFKILCGLLGAAGALSLSGCMGTNIEVLHVDAPQPTVTEDASGATVLIKGTVTKEDGKPWAWGTAKLCYRVVGVPKDGESSAPTVVDNSCGDAVTTNALGEFSKTAALRGRFGKAIRVGGPNDSHLFLQVGGKQVDPAGDPSVSGLEATESSNPDGSTIERIDHAKVIAKFVIPKNLASLEPGSDPNRLSHLLVNLAPLALGQPPVGILGDKVVASVVQLYQGKAGSSASSGR